MSVQITEIDGREVAYELLGSGTGTPVVVTPGGRTSMEVPGLRPLAEDLVGRGYRTLLWDRPNCGRSQVRFDGRSESHMRADVLASLLRQLDLGPAAIVGGSGGARDSAVFAIEHPDLTSHLAMWNLVGGDYGPIYLASVYSLPGLHAMRQGGVAGLIAMKEWQERIAANAGNLALLEAINPDEWVETMLRWMSAFVPKPGQTIPGINDYELARVSAPTMIVRGGEYDLDHPKRTSYEVHSVIHPSVVVDPPWEEDSWERAFAGGKSFFSDFPLMAPLLDDFLAGRDLTPAVAISHVTDWERAGSRYTPPAGWTPDPEATPSTVW